jgi:hypothetical protein
MVVIGLEGKKKRETEREKEILRDSDTVKNSDRRHKEN